MDDHFVQRAIDFGSATRITTGSPLDLLRAVDWDFPKRIAQSDIEGIHPYPAKFVSELPRALLATLPVPQNTAVLDPFCGSGTTLVECQRLGLPAIGIDLNPVACLMSRVKTAPCPADLESQARKVVQQARTEPPPSTPDIPNVDHWFKRPIQDALTRLTGPIDSADAHLSDCLRLALSSIVVRVSNQESDTRYAAVSKDIEPQDVNTLFLRAADRIAWALRGRQYPLSSVRVIEGDVLEVRPRKVNRRVGMVITSPPYPNAYEYWLYHKYRMWWLGLDPLKVKDREIGARAHFFKKDHHTAQDFEQQMDKTLALLDSVVVPGGYACFVVGRSRIHGQMVDNATILEEVATRHRFRPYFSAERSLLSQRKSFNLAHANIKTERVLVFAKEGS